MQTVRLRISGRVQGVGYRDWAMQMAGSLGLTGWVRNRKDGSVETMVSGDEAKIDRFVDACKSGPSLAFVIAVKVEPAAMEPGLSGFSQLPTA